MNYCAPPEIKLGFHQLHFVLTFLFFFFFFELQIFIINVFESYNPTQSSNVHTYFRLGLSFYIHHPCQHSTSSCGLLHVSAQRTLKVCFKCSMAIFFNHLNRLNQLKGKNQSTDKYSEKIKSFFEQH